MVDRPIFREPSIHALNRQDVALRADLGAFRAKVGPGRGSGTTPGPFPRPKGTSPTVDSIRWGGAGSGASVTAYPAVALCRHCTLNCGFSEICARSGHYVRLRLQPCLAAYTTMTDSAGPIRRLQVVFSPTRLTLQILDDEADPEERDDLASQLNKVLLGLDPGAVMAEAARRNRASDTHPFSTTKSDPLLVGALIVTLANSRLLTAVIEAVKTWIAGRKCSVGCESMTKRSLSKAHPRLRRIGLSSNSSPATLSLINLRTGKDQPMSLGFYPSQGAGLSYSASIKCIIRTSNLFSKLGETHQIGY